MVAVFFCEAGSAWQWGRTTSALDGHQYHLMAPLAGAPAVLPPTLARLIYGNQIRCEPPHES